MSDRKPSALIRDILNSIDRISVYIEGLTYGSFIANYMVVEACLYNVQVIGEAVSKLPNDVIKTEPSIPWVLIKGMRNRLVHEYFGTDTEIVWNVVQKELPAIKDDLHKIYDRLVAERR